MKNYFFILIILFIFSSCENIGAKTFECKSDDHDDILFISTSGKTFTANEDDVFVTGDFEVTDEYYFFRTIYEGEKINLQLNRYTKKLIIFENDEPDVWGTCELIKKSY